ncbi:MAG: FtsX-like permease family protein [Candidatus Hodarchaeota archaeon]
MLSMKFFTLLLLKKIARDILKQKMLFLALIVLCVLGTGSYLALTMGYTNLEASYNRIYEQYNFADAEISTHSDIWFNTTEIKTIINEFISNNPEIQAINYRLITGVGYNLTSSLEDNRRFFASGRAIGIDWGQPSEKRINDLIVDDGTYFNPSTPTNAVLLEAHFSQKFGINSGDYLKTQLHNQTYDFFVQGVVFSPEYLVIIPSRHDFLPTSIFGIIYLQLEKLQDYTNLTDLANNIIIKMTPNTDRSTRDNIIDDLFMTLNTHTNGSFAPPIMQEDQVSNLALQLDLETFKEIALILPFIVLGVAAISIYITLSRIIQDQKRIIGISSCLGYYPNDLLLHYICFSLLIGGMGSLLGIGIGLFASGGVTWIYSYFMRFPQIIEIQIQINHVIIALIAGLGVSFLSGAIPAWKASRMIPREALQTTATVEKGSHSILEKFPFFNYAGMRLIIPIRNLFRHRKRTSATITTIAAAVTILVISFAFIDSVSAGVDQQFNETTQYDLIVKYEGFKFFDLGVKEDVSYIRNLPGVIAVEPVLQIPSIIETGGKSQEVLITAWNTSNPIVHNFHWSSPQDTLLPNGSIVICSSLARNLNLHTKSTISYGFPRIPGVSSAFHAASMIWENLSSQYGIEIARYKTLQFISDLITQNKERLSFYEETEKLRLKTAPINVTGVSKEIWGSIAYTTIQTLTNNMGIDVFKSGLDIDLTPSSQLILKVNQPNNITLLGELQESIIGLDGVRSIEFSYDFHQAVNTLLGTFNAIVGVLLVFACLLAGAAIFTTIYVNFQERQREIATMLTMGLSDNEFMFIMTVENLIQAIFGIMFGIPAGLWVSSWLLDNILRQFYFEIIVQSLTWLVLWIGVIAVVLVSQIPAFYRGIKLDLTFVTKDLSN